VGRRRRRGEDEDEGKKGREEEREGQFDASAFEKDGRKEN